MTLRNEKFAISLQFIFVSVQYERLIRRCGNSVQRLIVNSLFEAHIGDTLFRFGENIEPFPGFKDVQPMARRVPRLPSDHRTNELRL